MIAEEIGSRFAKEDAVSIASSVAAQPGRTDLASLINQIKQARLSAVQDQRTKDAYSISFDAAQADITSTALINQAKSDAMRAADNAVSNFGDVLARGFFLGAVSPENFQTSFDELRAKVLRYNPSKSEADVRKDAFQILNQVAAKNAL